MRTERTRMTDRYPLTDRMTWAFLRAVDRAWKFAPEAVGFCALCAFYLFFLYVALGWMAGK